MGAVGAAPVRARSWRATCESEGFSEYDDLWRWSVEDLDGFWRSLWECVRGRAGAGAGARVGARCRARGGSRAPGSTAPSTCSHGSGDDGGRGGAGPRDRVERAGRAVLGRRSATRRPASRRACGGAAWGRATAWSPTCRTWRRRWSRSWRSPRIGAIWSSGAPEFGTPTVVDRFEQIEPKVLIAIEGYRYGGRDFDRSDRVRGDRARPCRRSSRRSRCRPDWDDRFAEPAALNSSSALRPSALGAVLVWHDRPAEGDRPGSGRDPAGAPEEGEPALEPRARGPLLLVHHDRLDDVELPGRRAAGRLGDRALRRSARPASGCGSSRARRG